MDAITLDISDLAADERNLLERFVGMHLTDDQLVVVQVLDADGDAEAIRRTSTDYAILADLNDADADELTEAMTQRSPGRDFALYR